MGGSIASTKKKACHCGIVGRGAAAAAFAGNRSRSRQRPTLYGAWVFVSDALFDGGRFRLLPVLDQFTHECLDIVADQSMRADDVAEAVTRLVAQRGKPAAIKVDNGSGFAGKVMDRGPTKTVSSWTFLDAGRRRITPWWKASMAGRGRSA
ncbi:DDE-type integrase/transposase/recombinase [Xanthomonas dyei]|uniref:DDE-type integrase/transposase/recombinase n=1 Tax=Xanthomonas dyei TaxID=743699 RepID=A0ABZ0D2Q1_9XANT|nr:DDE-type integrase/transposase/recombinase [Xanthomonas dyei]WOB24490.1 DDE-type integrase/transposase/recombinase [Xanthomonas dyei]WOB52118.1 DDE-type integrase/transposase/recombinase [Xanthomonas dyei]